MNIEDRIRALLAKADSTEFPEEAEALVAKVQELATTHAIDLGFLEAQGRGEDRIGAKDFIVDDPYRVEKEALLVAIAGANRLRNICHGAAHGGLVYLIGYESDIEATVALYRTLVVHAVRAMLAARIPPWTDPTAFRTSFLYGYAARIDGRLQEANKTAVDDAEPGAGLVLLDRKARVDGEFEQMFPDMNTIGVHGDTGSSSGLIAGARAATNAPLGSTGEIGDPTRYLEGG